MIDSKKNILFFLFFMLGIVSILVACGSGTESGSLTSNEQVIPDSDSGAAIPSNTPVPEEPVFSDGEVDTGYSLGYSLGSPNLQATDPSTVTLASGEIQLVEFFAYW